MNTQCFSSRRGFSLIEGLATVLVLSMIGLTMGPSLHEMRSRSMGITSVANMQEMGVGGAMYAGANSGRVFGYSWRAGETYLMPNGRFETEPTDLEAAARQNQEILQRRTGRIEGEFKISSFSGRIPHRRYNHLVLMDFLDEPLESTRYIDPADANQLDWQANPLDYGFGSTVPYAGEVEPGYDESAWGAQNYRQRWAFASSYQMVPSAWQSEYPHIRYIPIDSTPHLFSVSGTGALLRFSDGRSMTDVLYTSNKVWMFEEFDREAAGDPYFAYDHARSAKLMFDGSVNLWASGDAYPALVPEIGYFAWEQAYVPLDTFPVPLGGLGDQTLLNQRYRWTFRGLHGIDYGPNDPDGR